MATEHHLLPRPDKPLHSRHRAVGQNQIWREEYAVGAVLEGPLRHLPVSPGHHEHFGLGRCGKRHLEPHRLDAVPQGLPIFPRRDDEKPISAFHPHCWNVLRREQRGHEEFGKVRAVNGAPEHDHEVEGLHLALGWGHG